MSIFGDRLKQCRTEKGLTQEQFAEVFGIARNSVFSYETGRRVPDINMLEKFARYFEVTSDYLLGLSDNRTNKTAAIGDKIGLNDEVIDELTELVEILNSQSGMTRIVQRHLLHLPPDKHSKYEARIILETLNILALEGKLLEAINDYIFAKNPEYLLFDLDIETDDGWISTNPFTIQEEQEITQTVNLHHVKKYLDKLSERKLKEYRESIRKLREEVLEDPNAQKDKRQE